MTQAFFSYAHLDWDAPADRRNIERLVDGLEPQVCGHLGNKTFRVWRDEKDLRWGDNWRDELGSVLDETDFLIVLLSPGWLQSDVCGWEYDHFKKTLDKPNRILPLSLRVIDERQIKELSPDQAQRHKELRAIQQKSWANLPSLDDRDIDQLLAETAEALKDLALDLTATKTPAQTGAAQSGAAEAVPLDAHIIPPVSGDYYIPRQARDTCNLKLAVSGLASVETDEGTVVFAITYMTVQTHISGGRIIEENPKFAAPWTGPVATVSRAQTSAYATSLLIQANDTVMQGEPLAGPGDVGHIHLFNIEAEDDACIEITGSVNIQRQAVRIDEDQSDLEPAEREARDVMLRRLTNILLRDHIRPNVQLEGMRDDRSAGD